MLNQVRAALQNNPEFVVVSEKSEWFLGSFDCVTRNQTESCENQETVNVVWLRVAPRQPTGWELEKLALSLVSLSAYLPDFQLELSNDFQLFKQNGQSRLHPGMLCFNEPIGSATVNVAITIEDKQEPHADELIGGKEFFACSVQLRRLIEVGLYPSVASAEADDGQQWGIPVPSSPTWLGRFRRWWTSLARLES